MAEADPSRPDFPGGGCPFDLQPPTVPENSCANPIFCLLELCSVLYNSPSTCSRKFRSWHASRSKSARPLGPSRPWTLKGTPARRRAARWRRRAILSFASWDRPSGAPGYACPGSPSAPTGSIHGPSWCSTRKCLRWSRPDSPSSAPWNCSASAQRIHGCAPSWKRCARQCAAARPSRPAWRSTHGSSPRCTPPPCTPANRAGISSRH